MFFNTIILSLFTHNLLTIGQSQSTAPPQRFFNITTISAFNGKSTIECWQLTTPISISTDPGTSGTVGLKLGSLTNATYTVLPAKFNGGAHRAPIAQYVAFTAGLAHVTLPNSTDDIWIEGGRHGLIIAADTADRSVLGHITDYPGNTSTVALQIPFKDGKPPMHKVLHAGPCKKCEMTLED